MSVNALNSWSYVFFYWSKNKFKKKKNKQKNKKKCSIKAVQFVFDRDEYTFLMTHIYFVNFYLIKNESELSERQTRLEVKLCCYHRMELNSV